MRIQAARRIQDERRSEESRAAEDAELTAMARQAEKTRLLRETQEQQAVQGAQQWTAWTPVTFDFEQEESAEAVERRPEADAAESQTPKESPAKEKRGFFGLFGRKENKKAREPEPEAVPVSAPVPRPEQPAPQPEPRPVEPLSQKAEEPLVRLNVKPISWPAPPPPSRNFVHPPQSTTQFAAITPEQIRRAQAERARQTVPVRQVEPVPQTEPVPAAAPSPKEQWQPAPQTEPAPRGAAPHEPHPSGRAGVEYLEAVQKTIPEPKGTPTPYWRE